MTAQTAHAGTHAHSGDSTAQTAQTAHPPVRGAGSACGVIAPRTPLLLTCPEPACHRAWLRPQSRPETVLELLVQHLRRWHRLSVDQAVDRLIAVTA